MCAIPRVMLPGMTGSYRAHAQENDADCIVAFAFGFRRDAAQAIQPGPINNYLASVVERVRGAMPVIAQFEVDDALKSLGASPTFARIGPARLFLDTRAVAERSVEVMRMAGLRSALVVAQPFHMPRAEATLLALGVETVVTVGIEPCWDPASCQPWTRNAHFWRAREVGAIAMYASRGWL